MNQFSFGYAKSMPLIRSWCDGAACPEYRDNRCVAAGQTLDCMRACPRTITLISNGVKYGDKFREGKQNG